MSYPLDASGEQVDHACCRPVGAAGRDDLELAWFRDNGGSAELIGTPRSFRDWF